VVTDTLPIYEQTLAAQYDRRNATQRHPKEPPMNLLDDIRAEVGRAVTWTEDELRARLPTVAKLADDAEAVASSNAARAVLAAVLSPADEAMIVGLVQRLDQSAHAAAADAEQPPPGDQPPADPATVPAGPFVGGQA
jgi:hypothetical protein